MTSPPGTSTVPPDIVLLSADWPSRALIRAQLLEEGFEVVATDTAHNARTSRRAIVLGR